MQRTPEIVSISPVWVEHLTSFFEALVSFGENRYFHPHPLTRDEAMARAHYRGNDLYYLLTENETIIGYGMLRGWDAGYDIPSLGIVIHPGARGTGLGRAFMHFLHAVARRKGATKIRLKVYRENTMAFGLYRELGYVFESQEEGGQVVGYLNLV